MKRGSLMRSGAPAGAERIHPLERVNRRSFIAGTLCVVMAPPAEQQATSIIWPDCSRACANPDCPRPLFQRALTMRPVHRARRSRTMAHGRMIGTGAIRSHTPWYRGRQSLAECYFARMLRRTRSSSATGSSESVVARQQTWWSGRTSRHPLSQISASRAHSPL